MTYAISNCELRKGVEADRKPEHKVDLVNCSFHPRQSYAIPPRENFASSFMVNFSCWPWEFGRSLTHLEFLGWSCLRTLLLPQGYVCPRMLANLRVKRFSQDTRVGGLLKEDPLLTHQEFLDGNVSCGIYVQLCCVPFSCEPTSTNLCWPSLVVSQLGRFFAIVLQFS